MAQTVGSPCLRPPRRRRLAGARPQRPDERANRRAPTGVTLQTAVDGLGERGRKAPVPPYRVGPIDELGIPHPVSALPEWQVLGRRLVQRDTEPPHIGRCAELVTGGLLWCEVFAGAAAARAPSGWTGQAEVEKLGRT